MNQDTPSFHRPFGKVLLVSVALVAAVAVTAAILRAVNDLTFCKCNDCVCLDDDCITDACVDCNCHNGEMDQTTVEDTPQKAEEATESLDTPEEQETQA